MSEPEPTPDNASPAVVDMAAFAASAREDMALTLLNRMTGAAPDHPRFVGQRVDPAKIDALTLGDVWAVAQEVRLGRGGPPEDSLAAQTAQLIRDIGRRTPPKFRGPACRDYLDFLSREMERDPKAASGDLGPWSSWDKACSALDRCIDLSFDGLGPAASRFLAVGGWPDKPHLALALARLVDASFAAQTLERLAADRAGSPLLAEEIRVAAALDLPAHFRVAAEIGRSVADDEPQGELRHALSDFPGYARFAESGLRQAAERVRKLHDRETPYASDKAFTRDEATVVARLARVALDRDEPWAPAVLDELFRKVSVAPTAAKTLPSQAVAIALGHAIEAFSTPEAVMTLRTVIRDIRHAGVKKKLQRNLRGAERGLADRPAIGLRLPPDQPVSKAQLTILTRCLESSFAAGMELSFDDWRARLTTHANVRALTAALVWNIHHDSAGVASVLPVFEGGRLILRGVDGAAVAAGSDCQVTLWHPLTATPEERGAWRDRLAALRIRQPFKQVFREHYAVPQEELSKAETAMFAGHVVSIATFLGVARAEGWVLGYESLTRRFGRWSATLEVADNIYPGCGGATTTKNLRLSTSAGGTAPPVALGDTPEVTVSEILRAVDLLVSVSGFAVTGEDTGARRDARLFQMGQTPLGNMAETRKQALEYALRGLDGMENLRFDARHLRLGPYAIHLATGRVTRDGDHIEIDLPKPAKLAAVPWLPFDERLLETILQTALEIANRLKPSGELS